VKFAFIRDHLTAYPVELSCQVLEVSRAGYYAFVDRPKSLREVRRQTLSAKIAVAHRENRCVYGSPRICRVLKHQGEQACENTVAKLMRELGLKARYKRKFVPKTTDSSHDHPVARNLLDRQFVADKPNAKWVVDITYIPTDEGWLYLAGVMDLCSRKIVGWSMADHMQWHLVGDALEMALTRRHPPEGLLHHSDRGVQYACDDYRKLLTDAGMDMSMSHKGDCYDNAVMESFWSTLKTELVHHQRYATRDAARVSIFEYIETFYNRKRLHSALGYVSPEMFEAGLN
jgi:transposase InsO family protein